MTSSVDYYYCPKCDEVVKKSKVRGTNKVIEKGEGLYCNGKLGSTDHELTKLIKENGPPTQKYNLSLKFLAISTIGSFIVGFLTWLFTAINDFSEPLGLGFIISFIIFIPSWLINEFYITKKRTHEEIKIKALSESKKEKLKKAYGLDWYYSFLNGNDLLLFIGVIVVITIIVPLRILSKIDLSPKVNMTFYFMIGLGIFFVPVFFYMYLTKGSMIKLVPTDEKETKNIIRRVLAKNGIPFEEKKESYQNLGKGSTLIDFDKKRTKEFVLEELNLKILTFEDYRSHYINLTYNRIERWLYKRKEGTDMIEEIKNSIDQHIDEY